MKRLVFLLLMFSLCATMLSAHAGGPDTFGYLFKDSNETDGPTYSWITPDTSNEVIGLGDDDISTAIPMGMSFPFYEGVETEMFICSNGFLSFNNASNAYNNAGIPVADNTNGIIALFWDDLKPTIDGIDSHFYYENTSVDGQAAFMITFVDVPVYGGSSTEESALTAQAIFFADGNIRLQYASFGTTMSLASNTIGIENLDGTDGLQYAFNGDVTIAANTAIDFIKPTPQDSDIRVTSFSTTNGTPSAGANVLFTATIANIGSADATGFDVQLVNADGDVVLTTASPDVVIPAGQTTDVVINHTFDTVGAVTVYATTDWDADTNNDNNNSSSITLNIQDANVTAITIGDGTDLANTIPLNYYYLNSVTETIYLASELNIGGLMTGLAYYNNFATADLNLPVNIWIGETELTELTEYIPASQLTSVFAGNISTPAGENAINFTFDTPYNYAGGNLVVLVERVFDPQYYSSNDRFYITDTDLANRTLWARSDATDFDPETMAVGDFSVTTMLPNTTFFLVVSGMGSVSGNITDGTNGLGGVSLAIENTNYATTTAADGSYSFDFIAEDSGYTMTASLHGYNDITSASFDVAEDQTTTVNMTMVMLPTVTVTGQVITNDTSAGIQATVSLTGYEDYQVDTDASGNFTIPNVFASNTYAGTAVAAGYQSGSFDAVVGTTDLNLGDVLVTEVLFPATDIIAEIAGDDAVVTWGAPATGGEPGSWLTKGAEENNDGIGTGNVAVIRVAHRYTQAELTDYLGMSISAIKMFPREAAATYTLNVWGGADGMTELYSQDVTEFVNEDWNEYQLDTPVALPNTGDIYIGYTVDTTTGYPCGSDAGPHVDGGDMIMLGAAAEWGELHILAPSLDINWNLQAFVGNSRGESVALIGKPIVPSKTTSTQKLTRGNLPPVTTVTRAFESYNVYRFLEENSGNSADWAQVATSVTALTYTDTDWSTLDNGFYQYAVTSVYTNGAESNPIISNWLEKSGLTNVTFNVDSNMGNVIANADISLTALVANPDGTYNQFTGTTDVSGSAVIEVVAGSYDATVTAAGFSVYADVVDASSDVTVDVTLVEVILPATGVVAEQVGVDALITWGTPAGGGAGTWLTKGAEENNDGIGTGNATVIRVAHRYTQAELVDYQGMFINTIKMFPREATATYTLNVWGGADGMTELYSQDVTDFVNESWNEYQLDASVAIPTDGDLYIGYTTDTPSGYPCGTDAGPHVDGGDMIMLGDAAEWGELHILAASLDYNWNIQAYVTYGRGRDVITEGHQMIRRSNGQSTPQTLIAGNLEPIPFTPVTVTRDLEGYKVWRLLATDQGNESNWNLLTPAIITDLTYTDTDWNALASGIYKFAVKAIYTNDNEAPAAFSNELLNNMYGTVNGTVTAADTGTPISNAVVTLDGNDVTTDASGVFTFTDILAADYNITVAATGYVSGNQIITVIPADVIIVDFALSPSNVLFDDSFESYTDFTLEFGSWTNIDVDLLPNYSITGTEFNHSAEAFGYIVFNPSTTTPPLDETYAAHTGEKYLAAFAAVPAGGVVNNDWVISQQFTLGATGTVSFWAMSITADYGLERFNVLVSDGSTNPDDFVSISGATYEEAPTEWTEFTYDLSAYANETIRFAIQCVSSDAFIFMLDDISVDAPGGTIPEFEEMNPPTNLVATIVNDNDVDLVWEAPVFEDRNSNNSKALSSTFTAESDATLTRDHTGYTVYRDDVAISTVAVAVLTYSDLALAPGTYEYKIVANYDDGDSEASNTVNVTIVETEIFAPATNLVAEIDEDDVDLSWEAPVDLADGSWLTKGADENNDGIGTGDAADIRVAHRYTQDELVAYQGLFINTIKIFPREAAATYSLKVWGGDDGMTELYSQAIDNFLVESWNEYDLAASVAIPTDGDLYVGYFVSTTTGYPCGSDAGPHVDGGDMIMLGDGEAWDELHVLAASLDYNWNIQAFVSDASGTRIANNSIPMVSKSSEFVSSLELKAGNLNPVVTSNVRIITRDLSGYNVYRDGVEIASVGSDVLTYSDEDLENGTYEYYIKAVYNDEDESVASNTVSATINVIPQDDVLFADSFETYNDFALAFGEWTCIDVDLTPNYTITDTEFIHSGEAFAYIVFNPETTVPPLDEGHDAHTGTKYLAAFASVPSQGTTNNDWLISRAFTLADEGSFNFWAKSLTDQYGAERFNVLVSDGSTNPNDFTAISGGTYEEAPTDWTQFSYSLDAYADQTIRVAVQCVSNDAFIFMLDDVEVVAPNATPNNDNDVVMVTALGGNYPNPFNPETTISYNMKNSGNVTIDVYNILGQKVKTLVNENKTAGNHTVVWNGSNENNDSVASGVYFYKMRSGKYSKTHKMILMK